MSSANVLVPAARPGRGLFLLGLLCPLVGLGAYIAQISAQRLITPWYLPALSFLGLVLVALSLRQMRSVTRWIGFIIIALLTAATGAFLLLTRLPAYAGPLQIGQPYPAFETLRADGKPFTQADFPGEQNTVLVFFRGRW